MNTKLANYEIELSNLRSRLENSNKNLRKMMERSFEIVGVQSLDSLYHSLFFTGNVLFYKGDIADLNIESEKLLAKRDLILHKIRTLGLKLRAFDDKHVYLIQLSKFRQKTASNTELEDRIAHKVDNHRKALN